MPYKAGDIVMEKYRIEEEPIGIGFYGVVYCVTHLNLNAPGGHIITPSRIRNAPNQTRCWL